MELPVISSVGLSTLVPLLCLTLPVSTPKPWWEVAGAAFCPKEEEFWSLAASAKVGKRGPAAGAPEPCSSAWFPPYRAWGCLSRKALLYVALVPHCAAPASGAALNIASRARGGRCDYFNPFCFLVWKICLK